MLFPLPLVGHRIDYVQPIQDCLQACRGGPLKPMLSVVKQGDQKEGDDRGGRVDD